MGFFSFLDAFRSGKSRPKGYDVQLESPRRERQIVQESSRRTGGLSQKTVISGPVSDRSSRRRSMSRRRSWFGGKPDADEDIPAMPTLVRTDYNKASDLKNPTFGRSGRSNGEDYAQLPSDKRERRTSTYSDKRNGTKISALPPLPAMPTSVNHSSQPATSTLPDEQRRSRRQSMRSHHRSSSQASTRSRRKSRSFWASSNPDDDDEDVPPVPALVRGDGTPDSARNDPFEDLQQVQSRGRSSTYGDGPKAPRPVSTASRRSYVPRSAASGFLKSTNGASEDQRKSYRRSFKLGENVELVCVTDEHRVEWEKLMNKNAKLEDNLFAQMGRDSDESREGNRYSNAQALAALEFGVRA